MLCPSIWSNVLSLRKRRPMPQNRHMLWLFTKEARATKPYHSFRQQIRFSNNFFQINVPCEERNNRFSNHQSGLKLIMFVFLATY